jgi:cold shock CspA family protein
VTDDTRLRGTVRRYKPHFGFITADDGSDHFVGGALLLASDIQAIYAGDVLEFSVGVGRSGRPEATDIRIIAQAGASA